MYGDVVGAPILEARDTHGKMALTNLSMYKAVRSVLVFVRTRQAILLNASRSAQAMGVMAITTSSKSRVKLR